MVIKIHTLKKIKIFIPVGAVLILVGKWVMQCNMTSMSYVTTSKIWIGRILIPISKKYAETITIVRQPSFAPSFFIHPFDGNTWNCFRFFNFISLILNNNYLLNVLMVTSNSSNGRDDIRRNWVGFKYKLSSWASLRYHLDCTLKKKVKTYYCVK